MPGTPPRWLRAAGLGRGCCRSAGRTFTLTLLEFSGAAGAPSSCKCLGSVEDSRRSFTLGSLQRPHPPTQDTGPSPCVSHSHREARSAPTPPPSKPGLWWRLSHTPRGFPELAITHDPQIVPPSPPAAHPPQPPGSPSILSSLVAHPPSAPWRPVHPQPPRGPSTFSPPEASPSSAPGSPSPSAPPAARPPTAPRHPFSLQRAGAHPSPGPSGPAHCPPQYTQPRGSHAHLCPGSPGCPQPASCPLCLGRGGLVLWLQPPDPELPEGSPRAEESRYA